MEGPEAAAAALPSPLVAAPALVGALRLRPALPTPAGALPPLRLSLLAAAGSGTVTTAATPAAAAAQAAALLPRGE